MNSHSARAWKLPAFAAFYILASYLAKTLSHALYHDLYSDYPSEWLYQTWYSYIHMWFDDYALLSVPAWLLFHGGLLFTGMRYYRSGLSGWGWGLALFTLLCSTVGGIGVSALFLMLEIHGY